MAGLVLQPRVRDQSHRLSRQRLTSSRWRMQIRFCNHPGDVSGSYLNDDTITIGTGDAGTEAETLAHVPTKPGHAMNVGPRERQEWVLRELKKGAAVRRATVQERFNVADKTAKRDLSGLRQRGLVEYVRGGRCGYYRLPRP